MKLEELRSQIAGILEIDPSELTADSGPGAISTWDSMAALSIVSLIDDLYQGELSAEETEIFTSFGAIAAFARKVGLAED